MEFLGNGHNIAKSICPVCKEELDGATQVDGSDLPSAGDVSICIYCANIAVFCDDLTLREPTSEEAVIFENDPALADAQKTIREVLALLGKKPH